MTFEALGLRSEVLQAINEIGFINPTPIQEQAIPHLLQEDSDFVGLAQTGTGKTAAFGLPLLSKISLGSRVAEAIIICPTRELCLQITNDLKSFGKYLKVNVVSVYGGVDIKKQITDIKKGVDILVATPGRLMDLMNRKVIQLDQIRYVVLDEADEMLNMGFKEDIDDILRYTPLDKNVWLFSATMPKEVASIASTYMDNPLEVSIGTKNQSNENIQHKYFVVFEKDRYPALKRLIDFHPDIYGLIFCRTKHETANVAQKLSRDGYNAEPLHGDLSQSMRDMVMERFRNREVQLLVATDVAARGIDVDSISHVIHYNLPDDIENYTHRSGRTARAGKKGESLSLITQKEVFKIKGIERQINTSFVKGMIPNAAEICQIQLTKLVQKVTATTIRENDIAPFLPETYEHFKDLNKEEVIKLFISAEFNRFIEYYERAGDLNASERSDKSGKNQEREKGERRRDENKTRFFMNLGKRDGLNVGGLLRTLCDATGLKSGNIGRIDIMASFSFFDTDNEHVDRVLKKVNGATFEGHTISVEVSAPAKNTGSPKKSNSFSKERRGFSGPRSEKPSPGSFNKRRR
ncbi:MAG: DEAD/DEAH box helicase [Flavobacteriia bacterium]|nr:DEAD/DEAH box helicase [Flavobacteriia bacterium]